MRELVIVLFEGWNWWSSGGLGIGVGLSFICSILILDGSLKGRDDCLLGS